MKIRSSSASITHRATTIGACGLMLIAAGYATAGSMAMAADIWYVNADAQPGGDGTSWATAFRNLNDAISASQIDDEIWVAAGTYRPGSGKDRTQTFLMREGVDIYGGFSGTEVARDERNLAANPTVLSGDLDNNDGPGFTNYSDNVYHVVRAENIILNPRLDGFIIRGGYADGGFGSGNDNGGGILADNADITIANCDIIENWAIGAGGGVFLRNTSNTAIETSSLSFNTGGGLGLSTDAAVTVTDSEFRSNTDQQGGAVRSFNGSMSFDNTAFVGNSAEQFGGAIYAFESELTMVGCNVVGNSVTATSASGGAMNLYDSVAIIEQTNINANSATGDGGGLAVWHFSDAALINTAVYDNTSGDDGGGIAVWDSGTLVMQNRELSRNAASDQGGGMFVDQSSDVTLDDVDVASNEAFRGGGTTVNNNAVLTLQNSWYSSNVAIDTGGALNVERNARLVAVDGNMTSNSAGVGGAVAAHPGTTIDIQGVRISNNEAFVDGGAIFAIESTPKVRNNRFWINRALDGNGGAINLVGATNIEMMGNAFSRNRAAVGGAMALDSVTIEVLHCTLNDNEASIDGDGIALNSMSGSSTVGVVNSILSNGGNEIANLDNSVVDAVFSLIEGGAYTGPGVFNAEPTFVDPAAHNLMLVSGSRGVDAGNNEAAPAALEVDVVGNPRLVDDASTGDSGRGERPIVDMGAYETPSDPLGNQFTVTLFPNPMQTTDPQAIFVDFGRPGDRSYLVYSGKKGTTYVSGVNVYLDLVNPVQVGEMQMTDEEGTTVWILDIPGSTAGKTVYLQALQGGLKSNVIETTIVR
ncbi:MAG: right-handed parallel beta-helix repeat-containing protein [Planctomycetota bacterium]